MKIAKTHGVAFLFVALLLPARARPSPEPGRPSDEAPRPPPPGMRPEGGSALLAGASGPILHTHTPADERYRRRRPWLATLCTAGVTLAAGVVTGGLALERARSFAQLAAAGAGADELLQPRGEARQLAFATDLLLGTAALLGAVTLVLRFGTGTSRPPEPVSLERAYAVPGEEEQ